MRATRRAPSRLEQLGNAPRSLSPFLLVAALAAGNGLLALSGNPLERVAAAVLTLVAVLGGLRTLRVGTRASFAVSLALTALVVAMWCRFAADATDAWSGVVTLVLAVQGIGLCAAFLLSVVRLLSPLKAALLVFSAASTVAVGAVAVQWYETRVTETQPRPGAPSAGLDADREFFVQNAQTWLGPSARPTPGVGYAFVANSALKCCYPDNPRGYFDVEEIYGPQDMRAATLRTTPESKATFRPTRERSGIVRVEPATVDPKAAWRIAVEFLQIPLRAGVYYTVTCRARADRARPMQWVSIDPTNKYSLTGLNQTLTLTEDWRDYSVTFLATQTSNQNLIDFQVGQDASAVELTAFAVEAYARPVVTMEPDRWRTVDPATTKLTSTATNLHFVASGAATVERDLFPMAKGVEYRFTLRARGASDQPLTVTAVDAADASKWLGHTSTLALTRDWQLFGGRFKAAIDDTRPVFSVRTANATAGVEIAEFRFTALEYPPVDAVPQRYTVTGLLNAEGFRDRDHPVQKEPGTYRIACLGDSYTFGQGVHEQDTFVRRIEPALSARMRDRCEVMNFGVCGYCTQQERVCFEQSAAKYMPDLVVVTMLQNDNLSYEDEKKLGFHERPSGAALMRYWQQLGHTYEKIGYDVCVQELRKLRELCQQQGARLAVVVFMRPSDPGHEKLVRTVREGLKDTDVPVLDLAESLGAIRPELVSVHPLDGHPNDAAHGIAAERIVEFLCREVLAGKLK